MKTPTKTTIHEEIIKDMNKFMATVNTEAGPWNPELDVTTDYKMFDEINVPVSVEAAYEGMTATERRKARRKARAAALDAMTPEAKALRIELDSRKSYRGKSYPDSSPSDWSEYKGVGWVHNSEQYSFMENYWQCCVNATYHKIGEEMQYPLSGGGYICKAALDAGDYLTCPASGRYFPKSEGVEVYNSSGDSFITSPQNASRNYRTCSVDGKLYSKSQCHEVTGSLKYDYVFVGNIVQFGVSLIKQCPDCSRHFEFEHVKYRKDLDGTYCNTCYAKTALSHLIKPHNDKCYPSSIFTPKLRRGAKVIGGEVFATNKHEATSDLRLFGVELETEFSMAHAKKKALNRFDVAKSIKDVLTSDFVLLKEDGTLTMNGKYSDGGQGSVYAGFEIVSAPADLAAHREMWPKLEQAAYYGLLRSWDTETCGMHVHVSRGALTSLQIGRMLEFINHPANKRLVHKVAGRSERKFTRYVPKNAVDVLHPDRVVNPDEAKAHDKARRVALNISNEKTVEFRIFRGTIHPRHILRNLEFCDAVCSFCYPCDRSFRELREPRYFVEYVNRNRKRWSLLAEWMSHPQQEMIKLKVINMEKANVKLLTLNPDNVVEGEDKTGPAPDEMVPILVGADPEEDEEFDSENGGDDDDN